MSTQNILRSVLGALTLLSCLTGAPQNSRAESGGPGSGFVVLELFTSQGCSSCPPADVLLSEIAQRARTQGQALYALSFHVDYWNSLGWEDPFSGRTATQRQYEYAEALGSKRVFTPQLIINGTESLVGNRRGAVDSAIARFSSKASSTALRIELKDRSKKNIGLSYYAKAFQAGDLLRIAVVQRSAANYVPRGENSGSTLAHTNVVLRLMSIPLESSGEGSLHVILPYLKDGKTAEIIAFIQDPASMKIRAAASAAL